MTLRKRMSTAAVCTLFGCAAAFCSPVRPGLSFEENRAASNRLYESHTRAEFRGRNLRYAIRLGIVPADAHIRARITDAADSLGVRVRAVQLLPSKNFDCLPITHPDPEKGCETKVLRLSHAEYEVEVYAKSKSVPALAVPYYLFVSVSSSDPLPGLLAASDAEKVTK